MPANPAETPPSSPPFGRSSESTPAWAQRLSDHVRGLLDNLTEWINLQVELKKLEVKETVTSLREKIVLGVVLLVLALFSFGFLLTTLAFALGAWLGHPAWGFLIVTLLLLIATAVVGLLLRRQFEDTAAGPPAKALSEPPEATRPQLPERPTPAPSSLPERT